MVYHLYRNSIYHEATGMDGIGVTGALGHVVKQNDWTEALCFIAMSVTGTKDPVPFKCLY